MKKITLFLLFLLSTVLLNAGVRVVKLDRSGLPIVKLVVQPDNTNIPVNAQNYSISFNRTEAEAKFQLLPHGRIPLKSVILIDASYSINPANRKRIKEAAKKLVDSMREHDEIALFTLHDDLTKLSDLSSDKQKLKTLIDRFQPGGNFSRIYDAIAGVDRYLEQRVRDEQKTIILFSDGFDEGSRLNLEDCIRVTQESRIPVYSFGFSNVQKIHLENLKKISSQSRGKYSQEDREDFTSVLFKQFDRHLIEIAFKIIQPQEENYIFITNKKTGKITKIRFLMSLPEIQNTNEIIRKERNQKRLIYGLIILVAVLLIIFGIIYFIRKKKHSPVQNNLLKKIFSKDSETLVLMDNGKPVYLDESKGIYKVNLHEDDKELIAKAVLGQVNKNFASAIEYYKDLFQKNVLESENYPPFALHITDYLNSTTAFTLEESKTLYKTVETLKCDITEYDAKYAVNDLVGDDKYLRIISVLKQKKPSDYSEPSRRVSEYVPLLNDVFSNFQKDIQQEGGFGIEKFFNQDEDENFELLSDLLFAGGSGFEADKLLSELMELDSEKISKLLPFMIQVVKDSEGFEKDANFNLLRKMAQSLNLNIDNLSDIDAIESWWKKNKGNTAKQSSEPKSDVYHQELPEGFAVGDNFVIYTVENGNTVEFPCRITGGDKYSISYNAKKRLILDSVLCTYKPDLRQDDNILRINDHIYFRLVEIARVDDNHYRHIAFFITPNQKTEEDIKQLTALMFSGLK